MDYYYTLRDPLTIIVVAICSVMLCVFLKELSYYLRKIIPKNVECWFCHYQTLTSYDTANCWICENCEQYNGFSKDGDYNRELPNQYNSKLNPIGFTYSIKKKDCHSGNKLCDECTQKQQLKVKQLAAFVPMNEKNYDKEVEHFEKQIEKAFELCNDCKILVSKVLQNIREELSLPKKLSIAISEVKINGERAIFINILLSAMVVFSSLKTELDLPSWLKDVINQTFYLNDVRDYYLNVSNHSLTSTILTNTSQFLIATGIFTNFVGFYQTHSPVVFLNSFSWILMFFLTLYPRGYDDIIGVLKVIAGVISFCISLLILLRNNYKRNKTKTKTWLKRNMAKPTSPVSPFPRPHSNLDVSTPVSGNVWIRDSPPSEINSGMSSLSLGVKQRKELHRPIKRLISPANFNPFYKVSSYESNPHHNSINKNEENERNFQVPNKLGGFSSYEPSLHSSKISPSEKNFSVYSRGVGIECNGHSTSKARSLYEPYFHSCRTSPLEKNSAYSKIESSEQGLYQVLGKNTGYYEPSCTPHSAYESYESSEPVTTLTSCPYPQSYYPCTPTLAYYFSQHVPKLSPPSPFLASSTPNSAFLQENKKLKIFWPFLYSLPFVFLVSCNVLLLSTVYFRGT